MNPMTLTNRRPRHRSLAALVGLPAVAVAVLSLGACGSGAAGSDQRPMVTATTSIAADIVARVGGDDVDVVQLVPDGASPHSYAPSAREQQELAESALVVYFSPGLEQSLPIEAAAETFAFADHTGGIDGADADPHVWLDPTLIAAAVPDLAVALAELDPEHAAAFRRRARAYAGELRALDRQLQEMVASVPVSRRKLVTSHDLIGYFASRYGFKVVGAPFGSSPEAEASAGALAELIDRIEAEGVPAVFAQQGDDPEVLRRVAEEAGVAVVDDLALESLGGVGSYEQMMRTATEKITAALGA